MALRFYYDLMSQPSRAVYMFLRLNKIKYEDKPVALRKGEHYTDEFAEINPFKLVPVIDDNGFRLTESIAIIDYLTSTRQVEDYWFPAEPRKRARVNEYLHWQHLNTRLHCAMLFQQLLIIPRATGRPVDQAKVESAREHVRGVIGKLELYFLRTTPFISSTVVTAADLFAACELMQVYAVGEESLYEASPVVQAWMVRVRDATGPLFDEAHRVVYRVRDMYKSGAAKL